MPNNMLPRIQNGNKDLQLIQDNVQKAVTNVSQSSNLNYTPKDSQWASPSPANLQAALDRIVTLLVSLHGGPIP